MKTIKQDRLVTVTKEEMKHINNALSYGRKTELANIMGISRAMVTHILKPKERYSISEKKFVSYYSLKESHLKTINQFINSIKD